MFALNVISGLLKKKIICNRQPEFVVCTLYMENLFFFCSGSLGRH